MGHSFVHNCLLQYENRRITNCLNKDIIQTSNGPIFMPLNRLKNELNDPVLSSRIRKRF